MSEQPEKLKVHCLSCMRKTNHAVLYETLHEDSLPDHQISWWSRYQVVACRGCERISYRTTSGNSEEYDYEAEEELITEQLYPGRTGGKSVMERHEWLPATTGRIYREVLQALNNDAPILATIGLRALIESVCIERGVKDKTLIKSIDNLADQGLLSREQAGFLHTHRFLGNLAAHEMKPPSPKILDSALDIAETLLKTIYVLPLTVELIENERIRSDLLKRKT